MIKQIAGSVPIRELLAEGEEKLLHVALKEDPINSYTRYGADGTKITHTAYLPVPCGRPSCGICNNSQVQQQQNQKVASDNASGSNSSSSFISSRLGSVAAARRKLAFEEIEDNLFGR